MYLAIGIGASESEMTGITGTTGTDGRHIKTGPVILNGFAKQFDRRRESANLLHNMHTTINRTVILALLSVINAVLAATDTAAESAPTGSTFPSGYDMKSGWSSLRPYADAEGFSVPSGVPIGCELAEVHVLHRHAQRYPSSYETDTTTFASKIANYTSCRPGRVGHGPLEFLNRWKYLLGTDVLLPFGAATEDTSGAAMWDKYGRLLYRAPAGQSRWKPELNVFPNGTARRTPVFRTTDSQRILESARWWASTLSSLSHLPGSPSVC